MSGQIKYGTLDRLVLGRIGSGMPLPPALSCERPRQAVKVVFQDHGSTLCQQGGVSVRIGPGDGVVLDLSKPFQFVNEGEAGHRVAIVPKDLAVRHGLMGQVRRFSATEGVGRLAGDMLGSILQEMPAIGAACEAELAGSLLGLLALPLPREILSSAEEVRRQVKAHILANLCDPDLSIDAIAELLGCSKRYLHMCFAAEGVSIGEYLREVRLERCRGELERSAETGRSVTEIAFDHGFNSSSHFSRLFKQRFGTAPSIARGRRAQ